VTWADEGEKRGLIGLDSSVWLVLVPEVRARDRRATIRDGEKNSLGCGVTEGGYVGRMLIRSPLRPAEVLKQD
jgi:hypothetical protein